MQGRDQHSAGDPDTFVDVVVLRFPVFGDPALSLGEDDDQPRCGLQERLVGIGAQGRQRIEPFLARLAGIECAFLCLGSFADGALFFGR